MCLPLRPGASSRYPVIFFQNCLFGSIWVEWFPATLDRAAGPATTETLPAFILDIFRAGGSSATGAPVAVLSVPPLDDADIGDRALGVHGFTEHWAPSEGEGVRVWLPFEGLPGAPGCGHAAGSYGKLSGPFALKLVDRRRFEEPEAGLTCTLVMHLC